jgi:uncharacterized protein
VCRLPMKILFYFGHPAQYLFLRETIRRLSGSEEHEVTILIKTKDVLEQLLTNDKLDYINILPKVRGNSRFSIATSLIKRNLAMLPIILKTKPDLLIGTDATIAQLGNLLNINRITVTEDDFEVVKTLGKLSYPFTQTILCPQVCQVGGWNGKKVGYEGYMKLGYLHPNVFQVQASVLRKYNITCRFILIRLARLNAHHDAGINGIDSNLLDDIIAVAKRNSHEVFISSEKELEETYRPYQLVINPNDMHQILAQASLVVCDSQSMTMESAMLGTPSLRYSDFAGRISVLEELEHKYQLTTGISPGNEADLLLKMEQMLHIEDLRGVYQKRREKMLSDKIDVTAFLTWFIENYPGSKEVMQQNPHFQKRFLNTG